MLVLTPDPHSAKHELLVAPSAVPIPSAGWLFLSGFAGLFGIAHRRRKPRA